MQNFCKVAGLRKALRLKSATKLLRSKKAGLDKFKNQPIKANKNLENSKIPA
ncbi:MAG: hypothetical protein SO164_00935 [Campylobacter sp.]|nr:hypothetical protein [Campylobacter sp.]